MVLPTDIETKKLGKCIESATTLFKRTDVVVISNGNSHVSYDGKRCTEKQQQKSLTKDFTNALIGFVFFYLFRKLEFLKH